MASLILCIGNSTEDTADRSALIAQQYAVTLNGLLTEDTEIKNGCYYTDVGTVSVDFVRSVEHCFDLIILLDQSIDTYQHSDSYDQSYALCSHAKNYQPVIIQSQQAWCYVVKHFKPTGLHTVYNVKSNKQLYQKVMTIDTRNINLVLQLGWVDDFDLFTNWVNQIVWKCRSTSSQFIMFRADPHEENQLHSDITQYLIQFPEFVFLSPGVFDHDVNSNLQTVISSHWLKLYQPRT